MEEVDSRGEWQGGQGRACPGGEECKVSGVGLGLSAAGFWRAG